MHNINKTCFFTGHRIIPNNQKEHIRHTIKEICIYLIENHGVTDFIAGGAIGFDTLAAIIVIGLRELYPDIRLHLYLPCRDQTAKWRKADVEVWERILAAADDYRYITDGRYIDGCMQLRNSAMIKDAAYCIAYCTRPRSGTGATLRRAKERGHRVFAIKDRKSTAISAYGYSS